MIVTADNSFVLSVNQRNGIAGNNWEEPKFRNLSDLFKVGENLITVLGTNGDAGKNPAGLWLGVRLQFEDGSTRDIISDKSWKVSTDNIKDWSLQGFDDAKWKNASELGEINMRPWDLAKKLKVSGSDLAFGGRFREALQNKTALTTALGRPNREQVSTVRPSVATTLQALALTNGDVLSKLIKEGAIALVNEGTEKQILSNRIFQFALGRKPSNSEVMMIQELVEGENEANSVEDVLWALIMLPEFQLIY